MVERLRRRLVVAAGIVDLDEPALLHGHVTRAGDGLT